jgi:acyl-CoA synthetase (AMP-forming)/AMP-acid ligase II
MAEFTGSAAPSPQTLGDVSRAHRVARGGAVAFSFENREVTFAEFDAHANQVANGLIAAGIGKGEHVAYLGKNSDSYFELFFGAARMGAITTPVNWRLAKTEMLYILRDCDARALFVGPEFAEFAGQLVEALPALKLIVAMESGQSGWPLYAAWRDAQPAQDPPTEISPDDVALQIYTSGTSGFPKGAMLSHRGLLDRIRHHSDHIPEWNDWGPDDVSLIAMPVFHISGSGWALVNFFFGAKGAIAREFNTAHVFDFIQQQRITKLFMVVAAMQIMARDSRARETDFSCLKHMYYGASPIPVPVLRECIAVFGCGFVQLYGMTETSGMIAALSPEDHDADGSPHMAAAGKVLPGVELAIVDAEGKRLPPCQMGEIVTRSAGNMVGYWNLPDATAKAFDAERWFRTGDLAYLDEDGYLYIQDRVKDMIISGGENIYPTEVENLLCGHPDIAEAAVIGVPDPKWGEVVKAIVVPKPGRTPAAEQIIAFARQNIASYKAPKSVDFAERLPRTSSGKILRRELREPYWVQVGRRVN